MWTFHDLKDQYAITGTSTSDFIEFDCYESWCFFKSDLGSDIQTFSSCDYNRRYITDYELAGRRCGRCGPGTPFSYGFAADTCKPCSDLEGNYDNLPDIEKFMFNVACPKGTNDPVDCGKIENKEAEECKVEDKPETPDDPVVTDPTEEDPDVVVDPEAPVVPPVVILKDDIEGGTV